MIKLKIVFALLLLNTALLFAQNDKFKKFFPLQGKDLKNGNWILCLSELEHMSKAGDSVIYIMDKHLLFENKNSVYVITEDDTDCASKTAAYRIMLYHDLKQVAICSYCYPEQIKLGSLLHNFKKGLLLKEFVEKDSLEMKKDSIMNSNSDELISVVRLKKGMWKLTYLRLSE
jgi:hypothetical protein